MKYIKTFEQFINESNKANQSLNEDTKYNRYQRPIFDKTYEVLSKKSYDIKKSYHGVETALDILLKVIYMGYMGDKYGIDNVNDTKKVVFFRQDPSSHYNEGPDIEGKDLDKVKNNYLANLEDEQAARRAAADAINAIIKGAAPAFNAAIGKYFAAQDAERLSLRKFRKGGISVRFTDSGANNIYADMDKISADYINKIPNKELKEKLLKRHATQGGQ